MQETRRHIEAFDYYYSLGEARNFASVSAHCGFSERSIAAWSIEFNWQRRIAQRDIENGKKIQAKTDRAIVNTKADYRRDIAKDRQELRALRTRYERLVADSKERIEKGEIVATTTKELRELASALKHLHDIERDMLKLDLVLIGEPGSNEEISLKIALPEGVKIGDI